MPTVLAKKVRLPQRPPSVNDCAHPIQVSEALMGGGGVFISETSLNDLMGKQPGLISEPVFFVWFSTVSKAWAELSWAHLYAGLLTLACLSSPQPTLCSLLKIQRKHPDRGARAFQNLKFCSRVLMTEQTFGSVPQVPFRRSSFLKTIHPSYFTEISRLAAGDRAFSNHRQWYFQYVCNPVVAVSVWEYAIGMYYYMWGTFLWSMYFKLMSCEFSLNLISMSGELS